MASLDDRKVVFEGFGRIYERGGDRMGRGAIITKQQLTLPKTSKFTSTPGEPQFIEGMAGDDIAFALDTILPRNSREVPAELRVRKANLAKAPFDVTLDPGCQLPAQAEGQVGTPQKGPCV